MKTKEHWACEIQEPTFWTSFDAIAQAIQTDARIDLLDRIKSLECELSSTKSHNAEMLSFARRFSSTCAVRPSPDWAHKTADKIVQGNPSQSTIKALEVELETAKQDRNREGTKQRAEYLPKLTQSHAALQAALVALDGCAKHFEDMQDIQWNEDSDVNSDTFLEVEKSVQEAKRQIKACGIDEGKS